LFPFEHQRRASPFFCTQAVASMKLYSEVPKCTFALPRDSSYLTTLRGQSTRRPTASLRDQSKSPEREILDSLDSRLQGVSCVKNKTQKRWSQDRQSGYPRFLGASLLMLLCEFGGTLILGMACNGWTPEISSSRKPVALKNRSRMMLKDRLATHPRPWGLGPRCQLLIGPLHGTGS
jgi:hypothetical protein